MPNPADAIRATIELEGPITFAAFMELALYGPGGFYERPPVGPGKHFVTSPHVHPVFAELLAGGLRALWDGLGRPAPFTLVEAGAGDGTLAGQLLAGLDDLPLDYVAIERSAGARTALARFPIRIADRLEEDLDGAVVLANELLDNLPFRRVRGGSGGEPLEVRIDLIGASFAEVEAPCDRDLAAMTPPLEPGEETVVPTGALEWLDDLAARLRRGFALLIDYGNADPPGGEVHGYRGHRVIADVLDHPGSADITAGVNFGAVVARARGRGLDHFGLPTQRDALVALGLEDRLRTELSRQTDLLETGHGLEAVRVWGGRSRATLLADPAGPGGLRWLLLATPGLEPPAWFSEAVERSAG